MPCLINFLISIPLSPFLKAVKLNSCRTLPAIAVLLLHACATYEPQAGISEIKKSGEKQNPEYSIFIAGGLGNSEASRDNRILQLLETQLKQASKESTLLLAGDYLSEEEGQWDRDKTLIETQSGLGRSFKGEIIFLPGNNEWKQQSLQSLEKTEQYLKDAEIPVASVLPENGCPIEHLVINDRLDMILIDSRWFTSNWSRVKGINKKCTDIITRRRFAEELEGYINDGQGRNIVIAMHHPAFSNGQFAGKEPLKTHLLPVPVLGSLWHLLGELGAFSPERLNARRYRYLRVLVTALAKASDRIVIVSGHEESMQFLSGGGIQQIIAGSMGRKTATRLGEDHISTVGGTLEYKGLFTYGEKGFARLDYFPDGSSEVSFFGIDGSIFSYPVLPPLASKENMENIPAPPPASTIEASILQDEDFHKRSGFHEFIWGHRYRKYFGLPVKAPIVSLDTLYGGLRVTKEGGGHQSFSLRLEDKEGKEYAMRSLRKSALKFLKFQVKGVAYTEDAYEDTWTEDIVTDFFTTAHPYVQLAISPLARAAGINHSSPELFYVPKQDALGAFNSEFGDELYFIEERPSDEQANFKGYRRTLDTAGKVKDFESTTDMLEKIREDESNTIDQREFIRARVFDMLIGDWDRHQDQWRWIEYEKPNGDKHFQPVPRDRDNAFPKFDGFAMPLLKLFIPASRRWESYGPAIKDIKWLNIGGNQLDRALLTAYDSRVWEEEARSIQQSLEESEIDHAFARLPEAVQDSISDEIKNNLKARLEKLPEYAIAYSRYLNKVVALHGTEKDDLFEITRLPGGKTRVVIRRLLTDKSDELMYDRTFDGDITRELWIYGLGDDDRFQVRGEEVAASFIRLVGGYGEDHYDILASEKLKVYDWKHEQLHFEAEKPARQLSNRYQTNTYHWRFFEENHNVLIPGLGFRTDDGIFLGVSDTYTINGFNGNPYRQRHRLGVNYYFGFKALELTYSGIFANIFPNWNFEADGYFASDRYSQNFFGMGNESVNQEDQLGRDFHRSRMQITRLGAGIAYHTLRIKALYESFRLSELPERYFNTENLEEEVFSTQSYLGGELSLYYKNDDAEDFPTKALSFGLHSGYKWNPGLSGNHFGYLNLYAGFSHKIIPSGNMVLASTARVNTNFGERYFFYHAPSLGGNNGLRGFRDERFAGKTAFYQSSDLRVRLKRFVTPVVPLTLGAYAGFDYGRVWQPGEDSDIWHNSLGGGVWLSGVNYLTFNAGFFHSKEGNMIQAGFGFDF